MALLEEELLSPFDIAARQIRQCKSMRVFLVALAAAILLTSCSDDPKPVSKAPEPPAAPITGRQAFQYVYGSARLWAPDAQPLTIRSIHVTAVKSEQGKAGAWEAVFVSPSTAMGRTYSWSAVEDEGLHKGVFPGPRQAWSPGGAEKPFAAGEIKIDTPEALTIATKASAEYLEKPGQRPPINFLLEVSGRFPSPAWRVLWGNTVSSAEYTVTVDAATGMLLAKE
jgi:hypothetical protein